MIGWGRKMLSAMLAALGMGLGAGMATLPYLGQQRTLSQRPGSGLVRASGRPPKPTAYERKRDAWRMALAENKRARKNAKRWRDAAGSFLANRAAKVSPFVMAVPHGR